MKPVYGKFCYRISPCLIEGQTGDSEGFSLVELLLVVGVIGVMLWLLIPIGLRTRVDATYGVVRQNCSELASYTHQWAQQAILTQDEQESFATLADYYGSLAGLSHAPLLGAAPGQWVANGIGPTHWRRSRNGKNFIQTRIITGRFVNGKPSSAPQHTVEDVISPHHPIRNPFTNTGIFESENFPLPVSHGGIGAVPGAVAFGGIREKKKGWVHFAFVFQGTNNTGTQLNGPDTFFAGMNLQTLRGLQNGVFAARIR
ncbi:MAG: hypothetical protein SRB2_02562 [Desulfobacteraceae bacterium Eth-SRB2]|nr:MAG: hypothetical protein SRB2_02562 [Desulfobacteraceae bacterium Eth-SRB2]